MLILSFLLSLYHFEQIGHNNIEKLVQGKLKQPNQVLNQQNEDKNNTGS